MHGTLRFTNNASRSGLAAYVFLRRRLGRFVRPLPSVSTAATWSRGMKACRSELGWAMNSSDLITTTRSGLRTTHLSPLVMRTQKGWNGSRASFSRMLAPVVIRPSYAPAGRDATRSRMREFRGSRVRSWEVMTLGPFSAASAISAVRSLSHVGMSPGHPERFPCHSGKAPRHPVMSPGHPERSPACPVEAAKPPERSPACPARGAKLPERPPGSPEKAMKPLERSPACPVKAAKLPERAESEEYLVKREAWKRRGIGRQDCASNESRITSHEPRLLPLRPLRPLRPQRLSLLK